MNSMAGKNQVGYMVKNLVSLRRRSTCSTTADIYPTKWELAKPFNAMPSHTMLPLIGTAWIYMPLIGHYRLDQQHIANRDKQRHFGDIFREKIGNLDIVVSFRPDDLREILQNEGVYPQRVEFTTIKAYRELRKQWYSTAGLLVIQGKEWHHLRMKTSKHLLRPQCILQYLHPVQEVAKEMVQRIYEIRDANNEIPDIVPEFYKWTLESVCLIGLDARLGCLDHNLHPDSDGARMIESVLTQFNCMVKLESFSGHIQFWKLFPTPTWKKLVKAADTYAEIAFKYIQRALDTMEKGKNLTIIQGMMANKDMDVRDVMVSVADFLMAGIETTAHSASFLLYRLARDPERQERLYKDIIEQLPSKDQPITYEVIENLKFLRACCKESLRLNPVVGGTARHLAQDTVLSGYQVPAGTLATVPYQEMFTDERWFERASEFVPERWLQKDKKTHPFAFVPFGFGPRSCVGKRIAEAEISCLIIEILRHFRVEYHHEDFKVKTLLVNIPDRPLPFTFIER